MKKFFLLALAGLCAHVATAQTIRRVNNTPGLNDPNVYATAQAAHDAAVDGDIISLEPAGGANGVNYGVLTVNRRVNIYGTGYFLDKGNPNVPFDKRPVTLSTVYFNSGSANSTIKGARVDGTISIAAGNITADRCYIITVGSSYHQDPITKIYSYGNNATITRCVISGGIIGQQDGKSGIGIVATNNIIGVTSGTLLYLTNSVITRNTFVTSTNATYVNGCTFTNNIIDARTASSSYQVFNSNNSAGNSVSNNICLGANGLPPGNGNVNGADPTTTFVVEDPYPVRFGVDSIYKLAPNSPAKTVAAGGGEAGAFGGGTPYLLSGLPPIPIITNYFNSGSGNVNTPLSVTISVGSNN